MAYPNVPRMICGYGIHDSIRYGSYGKKPVRFKNRHPFPSSDPHLPVIVLEERLHLLFRQSAVGNLPNHALRVRADCRRESATLGTTDHARPASLAINGDLSFIPSVEAIRHAQP